jgi:hypothetical protein
MPGRMEVKGVTAYGMPSLDIDDPFCAVHKTGGRDNLTSLENKGWCVAA